MAWITLITSGVIAAPMGVWLTGAGPTVVLIVNATSLAVTIRLLAAAAGVSKHMSSGVMVGVMSGLTGSLLNEILVHLRGQDSIAAFFSTYAALGDQLYRMDMMVKWWPFAFVGLSALGYGALAALIHRLVWYRREILGLTPRRPK